MMAFVGQVSTLYALPASFFCLTATMPSGHHNTHQPLPHHPLTLCYLWHWWQHLTTVTWQWWCNVAVTMDVHNDNQWPRMMRRMRWATMDNNKDVQVLPSSPCPPPLIDPYVVLASHSIFSQLHTCFPYVRSSETGWDWSFNWQKLTKTALNWLTLVQSSFSRFFSLWGPVLVPVLSNFDKRLDWTGLPSTTSAKPDFHM